MCNELDEQKKSFYVLEIYIYIFTTIIDITDLGVLLA